MICKIKIPGLLACIQIRLSPAAVFNSYGTCAVYILACLEIQFRMPRRAEGHLRQRERLRLS